MASYCRVNPVVFKKNGKNIEEVDSKLFQDIKEAIGDYETSWKMWAFTKTQDFKRKYKNVEYDELGEVTFPSLIKALGLEDVYNKQKTAKRAAKDYGLFNHLFDEVNTALRKMEEFNAKEEKLVSTVEKKDGKYEVVVRQKTGSNIERARQQSYRRQLTAEIIGLLRTLGFDVGILDDAKYDGLFDPEDAKLVNGFIEIIKIARGEQGEEALPEEFSHLLIRGLKSMPLVQRLLATIDESLMEETLGEQYEQYLEEYDGDMDKMREEVAGKMLAQYIKKEGTIRMQEVNKRKGLLSRIWSWVKNLFKRVTDRQLADMRMQAYDKVAEIYKMVASDEILPYIDKHAVLTGEQLAKLSAEYASTEKIANLGMTLQVRLGGLEAAKNATGRMNPETYKDVYDIQTAYEQREFITSISTFLDRTKTRLEGLHKRTMLIEKQQENNPDKSIKTLNYIAGVVLQIDQMLEGYGDYMENMSLLDMDSNWMYVTGNNMNEDTAEMIARKAKICKNYLGLLKTFRATTTINVLYDFARTEYRGDKERGIGDRRQEVMALWTILDHAERDINFVDHLFSALYDCDDALLSIVDGLVKNQKYERDLEMVKISTEINALDKKLRDSGHTSEFILERNEKGEPVRLLSPYDWDTWREEKKKEAERLRELGYSGKKFRDEMEKWLNYRNEKGVPRMKKVYVDPDIDARAQRGEDVGEQMFEMVPNPDFYPNKAHVIEDLSDAEKNYYHAVINIKRKMMARIPHRGQHIYKTINISKDLVEGIMDNETGNPLTATVDYYKRKFVRRPDDVGFGLDDNFKEEVRRILASEKDSEKAAEKIKVAIANALDRDIFMVMDEKKIRSIIERNKKDKDGKKKDLDIEKTIEDLIEQINLENFYLVETDFAGQRIQKLPIYYTRKLKNPKMLTTDFSGALIAYSAMAVNYQKMEEIINLLELMQTHVNQRDVRALDSNKPLLSRTVVFDRVYKRYVVKTGAETNIGDRFNHYMESVVYEKRTIDVGNIELYKGVSVNVTKVLEVLKDYTGILGLGLNIFSAISNLAVGKIQQWIEAWGGEWFDVKDYAKAIGQYTELMPGCFAEMGSPIKKNKLSLLIQMFDPMGEYYNSLRDVNHSNHKVARILGTGSLGYLGLNAGEHILHCQTMLAILNHIKLIDTTSENGEEISLFDALEVKENQDGSYRLELREGLAYKRDMIETKEKKTAQNERMIVPVRDENGKIKQELVPLKDNDLTRFLIRTRKIIHGVNASLNGDFNLDDKGIIHRWAILKLVMQYRQWMPAHYMRRFARAHYDTNLEQFREGYYTTMAKIGKHMLEDIAKGKWEQLLAETKGLSDHEKANLRRAQAEIAIFWTLIGLCKIGGKVGDEDRVWAEKMALYQLYRMRLEVGSSTPCLKFFQNMITILNSPSASLDTLKKVEKAIHMNNLFDEIQSGRYEGWMEFERDLFNLLPYAPQIFKAWDFDDSMFTTFKDLME